MDILLRPGDVRWQWPARFQLPVDQHFFSQDKALAPIYSRIHIVSRSKEVLTEVNFLKYLFDDVAAADIALVEAQRPMVSR